MCPSATDQALSWVGATLGYNPVDPALFRVALTHRSVGSQNNERLEFLGDAVLNLLIAEHLFQRFPDADEGALSRLRASVVSGESLARVAAGLKLGDVLFLGGGELKTGGFRRESILADALEAVCGALYLDAGIDTTRQVMCKLMSGALEALDIPTELKDAKTRLQEWLQARGLPLPHYSVERIEGESHAQHFTVNCEIETLGERASGEGSNRRRAEQAAAQQLLERLLR